jgi:hypothetical protein
VSEPDSAPPLQFDTAVPINAPSEAATSAPGVTCVVCQQTITDEYFDVNGQSVCSRCQKPLANHAEVPRGFGVFVRAALYGLGAAILGAILYYAVIAVTDFEIGIVAIAIGYMVGYAIRLATGGRGGRRFQVLALVLTYWAVGLAYTPIVFKGIAQREASSNASASSQPAPAEPASEDKPLGPGALIIALGIVLAFSFALPVLTVFGSLPAGLLSGAIIAFGMRQAWNMTGSPPLVITGPFRIAPPLASA